MPTPIIDDEADTSDLASLDHLTTTPALLGEPTSAGRASISCYRFCVAWGISATLEARALRWCAAGFVEHILKHGLLAGSWKSRTMIRFCSVYTRSLAGVCVVP